MMNDAGITLPNAAFLTLMTILLALAALAVVLLYRISALRKENITGLREYGAPEKAR